MMRRVREISKALENYDRCLYAVEMPDGRVDVYRKNRENISPPHFIFSITDNWTPQGQKRDWGIEPILNRLRAIDLWRDDGFVERHLAEIVADGESKDRARRNSVESFLYDFRSQFHKTFNDVNTSTMEKRSQRG